MNLRIEMYRGGFFFFFFFSFGIYELFILKNIYCNFFIHSQKKN